MPGQGGPKKNSRGDHLGGERVVTPSNDRWWQAGVTQIKDNTGEKKEKPSPLYHITFVNRPTWMKKTQNKVHNIYIINDSN